MTRMQKRRLRKAKQHALMRFWKQHTKQYHPEAIIPLSGTWRDPR
jgi:hypothetical protein